ncbi:MAG: hypothetical protein VX027_03165 [Bacteroidota bacterium]|nr:hypothetical protein [Bacteroidota bacterium]MEC8239092.1 hypothetical protein [Bacteroidota bacterium]
MLGSAKVWSRSNVESKHLSLELTVSGKISLANDSQNVSVHIIGFDNVDLKAIE